MLQIRLAFIQNDSCCYRERQKFLPKVLQEIFEYFGGSADPYGKGPQGSRGNPIFWEAGLTFEKGCIHHQRTADHLYPEQCRNDSIAKLDFEPTASQPRVEFERCATPCILASGRRFTNCCRPFIIGTARDSPRKRYGAVAGHRESEIEAGSIPFGFFGRIQNLTPLQMTG